MGMGIFNDNFGFLRTGNQWMKHLSGGIAIFELQSIGDEVVCIQMLSDEPGGDIKGTSYDDYLKTAFLTLSNEIVRA